MTVANEIVAAGNKSRLILLSSTCVFSIAALGIGAWLMNNGVEGKFTLFAELKGWTLYMTSLAPGLLFLICGTVAICLAIQKKVSMKTDHGNGQGFTHVEN
jgi:hypothetical protein